MSLELYPRHGDLVRFDPPEQSYSAQCAQTQKAGQTGTVFKVDNDSFVTVWFGKDLVFVNTAYLTLIANAHDKRVAANSAWPAAVGEDKARRGTVKSRYSGR